MSRVHRSRKSSTRVLLLWPGTEGAAAGNFGVPQLVLLGTYARQQTGAEIHIRDLVAERALGLTSFADLLAGDDGEGFDVIALSIYSSFDHLKCQALAEMARELYPNAVIVCGGYHASARPLEYVRDGSPFDVCVVGEGERPLVQIIESVQGGEPLRGVVLGPDAIDHLDDLPPSDWSLLARYRGIARHVAAQAQVYLSRGCPFDCAFCMERAKREVSWRPLGVERALEEITSLHRFLDLRGWTLYFGDALFGMKKSWRREFLEGLARLDVPVEKYWLLIRVDLVDDEDLRLFSAANCGLGFGLESGDPGLLATIRKSGRLEDYLDRMDHVAERAREHDVPWGANIICGHPGETPATLERTAKYMERLFLSPRGTTGFLSVDPFRLYPGSPIDADRGHYERAYGTRFHRPHWWDDGDPEFLSEWVDPSDELDWLGREELQQRLLAPVLAQIEGNFCYRGPAREYFLRAVRDQHENCTAGARLPFLGRYLAWQRWMGRRARAERERDAHPSLAELCREERSLWRGTVAERADLPSDHPILDAIERVPRERFVPVELVQQSTRDEALALDDSGLATVSAMHAYARAFSLLEISAGDRVLDLGAGSGYGSAILAELVGPSGHVTAVEIDATLFQRMRAELEVQGIVLREGDAHDPSTWGLPGPVSKIVVGFAIGVLPEAWVDALALGTRVVAPLHCEGQLRLAHASRVPEGFAVEFFEPVSYVAARVAAPNVVASTAASATERVRLVVLP